MIFPYPAISDERQLYLLTGCPTPKSGANFPSSLYKIDQKRKTLVKVREVVTKEEGMMYIYPYYDERIITIWTKAGTKAEGKRSSRFAVVNMNEPKTEKNFDITYPDTFIDIEAHLLDILNKGLYQEIEISRNRATEIMLLGINLSTMKQEELSWDVYKYVKLSGIPGGATPGEVFVVSSRADGQILISTVGGKIEAHWKLPPAIKVRENENIGIYINNNDVLVLLLAESRVKKARGLGYTPFHILDKKTNKWHSVKFQGGRTGVRGFGLWLAGYVSDEEWGIDSPGRAKRRKDMTETGTPVDWRFKDFKIYSPGILFLYNAQTREKYTIETGQGDSEVLLVEGDTVYYRVNDKIYQAKISKNKLEDGTLLVKDEVVPDIHWAFMGPQ
jgi:hypothetical protein